MPDHSSTVTPAGGPAPSDTAPSGSDRSPSPDEGRLRSRVVVAVTVLAGVILVVGTIGPPLFGQGVFLGGDLLEHSYPWRAVKDGPASYDSHGPVSDTVDAVYPSRAAFFDALSDGELLGWSPDVAGGRSRGTQSGSGVLDPFAFPSYVVAPDWYAPALIKLLTMGAAIGFTFLFCRRLGADRAPALFAGLAFAGSGFMVMWTNWPQPEVAALIPALFWATERFLQRPRVLTGAPISLVLAGMLLGNFPAIVFYTLYLLGPYALVRAVMLHRDVLRRSVPIEALRRLLVPLGGAAAAMLAGVLLVAAVLLPFALGLGDTGIGDRSQTSGDHLPVSTLLTTVAPKAFGLSTEGPSANYFGPANQVEVVAFVGITTALLALLGLALPRLTSTPRGARAVLAGGTLVLGWVTFAGGPLLGLLQNLPAFDNSYVGRTRSVMGFTVAVLAGLGLQAVVERRWPATRRQWGWAGGIAVLTAGAAGLVGWRALSLARAAERSEVLRSNLVLPAAVGLAACAVIALAWYGRHRRWAGTGVTAALACLPVLLAVEAVGLAAPLTPNVDRSDLYPTTPGIDYLVENTGDERLAPEDWVFFGSASSVYGLRSVAGHSFYDTEWKEALLAVDPDAFSVSPTFPFLDGTPEVMASPLLDRMGVGWWAGSPGTVPPGRRDGLDAASAAGCDQTVPVDGEDGIAVEVPAAQDDEASGLRAIVVRLCDAEQLSVGSSLSAELDGTDGRPVAAGRTVLGDAELPGEVSIALPAEDLPAPGGGSVRLTVDGLGRGTEDLTLAATPEGEPVADVIRPDDDGLRLVYADDLRIYERTSSLGRIHWAGEAIVVPDAADRLDLLTSGDLPDDTVVLDKDGPSADGAPAQVDVTRDTPSGISMTVDAEGAGYVVIADSIQRDWAATVDGEPADLVPADHAGAAVHVPEGRHEVELHYRPRGYRPGLAISGATGVLMAAACLWDLRRRRRD